jgi:hypothetical protein
MGHNSVNVVKKVLLKIYMRGLRYHLLNHLEKYYVEVNVDNYLNHDNSVHQ